MNDRKLSEKIRVTFRNEIDVEELADRVAELEQRAEAAETAQMDIRREFQAPYSPNGYTGPASGVDGTTVHVDSCSGSRSLQTSRRTMAKKKYAERLRLGMKPSERIEQIANRLGHDGVVALRNELQSVVEYLDEQHAQRDERAKQKLRKLHDELRCWKLDYEQRISRLDPENTRDIEIAYKAFVVGIDRLLDIIEQ